MCFEFFVCVDGVEDFVLYFFGCLYFLCNFVCLGVWNVIVGVDCVYIVVVGVMDCVL